MKIVSLALNLPWSFLGLLVVLISIPKDIKFDSKNLVLAVKVKWLWLSSLIIGRKVKGLTMGNVIMLSDASIDATYHHEMIHIVQFRKIPLIFPMFYCVDFVKNGYRQDQYEKEAYKK